MYAVLHELQERPVYLHTPMINNLKDFKPHFYCTEY